MKSHLKHLLPLSLCAATLSAQQAPTNFVVILMDDMGYGDIKQHGAVGYDTPHIDQLCADGMTFNRYYAPQAVSGASRAGLLTGCYPNRLSMSGAPFPGSPKGINASETTMGELLQQKGYATAIFGKWHLGDQRPFLPLQNGFDEYYGIPYSNDMWPNHPTMSFPDLPLYEGNEIVELNPDQTQLTTNFTQRSVNFIRQHKDQPFFLYLAHPMPHVPLFVSDKFKGKSQQGLYGDVMMEIDWSIGQVLQALREEGLEDNTLVVVISDNGPWLNYGNHSGTTGGLREGKGVSFEGGQRVPCIMYWKGHTPKGSTCNKLVTGLDIFPTFAHLADAPLPAQKIDGVDITPLIMGDTKANPRKSFYYYYRQNDLEAVTDGHYKLVFPHKHRTYVGFEPGKDGAPGLNDEWHVLSDTLLFDLRLDPGERNNILRYHPDIQRRLNQMAEEAKADLGDNLTKRKGKNVRPCGNIEKDH